ncbi:MAG: hypothetical protein LIO54_04590 [Oscillospiraceae bacterium]|nr:hypothetical protein [Oscillospiraceae bacterium]
MQERSLSFAGIVIAPDGASWADGEQRRVRTIMQQTRNCTGKNAADFQNNQKVRGAFALHLCMIAVVLFRQSFSR